MSVKMGFWSFKWQNGIVGNDNLIISGSGGHKNRWTTPKNHVNVSHWTFLQILHNLFHDTTKYNCFSLGYNSCEELDTWTKKKIKKIILIFHTAQCFIIWPTQFSRRKKNQLFLKKSLISYQSIRDARFSMFVPLVGFFSHTSPMINYYILCYQLKK